MQDGGSADACLGATLIGVRRHDTHTGASNASYLVADLNKYLAPLILRFGPGGVPQSACNSRKTQTLQFPLQTNRVSGLVAPTLIGSTEIPTHHKIGEDKAGCTCTLIL